MTFTELADKSAAEVIEYLNLQPLDHEGAYWGPGPRNRDLSVIFALLTDTPEGFSAMHALAVTEGWQWLAGSPTSMLQLHPDGSGYEFILDATSTQLIVPQHVWQGASTLGAWSLFSCWCAPGFEWSHFRLGDRTDLIGSHPQFETQITRLTRHG